VVDILLREHNHGALGAYAFAEVPRIGETINLRQTDKSTYFQVFDVEHVLTDPTKPASVNVSVKRVVKWPM
jgi:hypothetical protein